MQPYFFPYIGYFQLMNAVDIYVIADDLHFEKSSFIKRNYILEQKHSHIISLQLIGASQNKLINEIEVGNNKNKLLQEIERAYNKAPFFHDVFPLLQAILGNGEKNLAKFLSYSIKEIAHYLDIQTKFICSHDIEKDNHLRFDNRIMDICKVLKADKYINAIGGKELYDKDKFQKQGIQLSFLETNFITYKEFENDFIPNLSIIDVMMFNSKDEIKELLNRYELI